MRTGLVYRLKTIFVEFLLFIVFIFASTYGSSTFAANLAPEAAEEPLKVYGIEIVNTYPHDPKAFTQGLIAVKGQLYEGTGRNGESSLRLVELESGRLLKRHNLNSSVFGEGITLLDDKIYQLTWQSHIGYIYQQDSFELIKQFYVPGEGWGITHDGSLLIVSDGTSTLRFLDPDTQTEVKRLEVSYAAEPVNRLNELEYINGEIWANIWYEDIIVRIDPLTGMINSVINLNGLNELRASRDEVLNGIAWDETTQRLFVTGKLWPNLFEIRLVDQ